VERLLVSDRETGTNDPSEEDLISSSFIICYFIDCWTLDRERTENRDRGTRCRSSETENREQRTPRESRRSGQGCPVRRSCIYLSALYITERYRSKGKHSHPCGAVVSGNVLYAKSAPLPGFFEHTQLHASHASGPVAWQSCIQHRAPGHSATCNAPDAYPGRVRVGR
jgi:hypothetical protein